jgi:hypothetical protein
MLAGLFVYYERADSLRDLPLWADVALTALVLVPAVFALVLLVLPLREARGLAAVGLAFVALAATLEAADLAVPANFAKLFAVTLLAFWFLGFFERPSWIVLVAAVVPAIDAVSVWIGPTKHVVTERPEVFDAYSFAFPLPHAGSFRLGLTDLAFFTLFLGAAARWGLRVGWTWVALVASLGGTIAVTVYVDPFGIGGVPALPGLSLAFLLANADHVVRILRRTEERVIVTLPATDAEASARFYRHAIGARAGQDGPNVRIVADWSTGDEVGFEVGDLDDAHVRAVRNGAEVVHAPRDEPGGRSAMYRDRDGNVVVLIERA